MYKVYAKTDAQGRVIAINSSAFLADLQGWTEIDQGEGDKYHHAQGNYLPGPLYTDGGVPRYALVDGVVAERTATKIQTNVDAIPSPPPDPVRVMFRTLAQADVITPAQALDNRELFDLWADRVGSTVTTGEYLRHEGGLYRVQQGHPVQAHQPPSVHTAALYTRVQEPGQVEAWASGQSYAKDVEVSHTGGVWQSGVDNNVWEPGAQGVGDNIWRRVRDA